jgi:hypothetical protein
MHVENEKHYAVIKSLLKMCDAQITNFFISVHFTLRKSRAMEENVIQ